MSTYNIYRALEDLNYNYLREMRPMRKEYVMAHRLMNLKKNFPLHMVPWVRRYMKSRKANRMSAHLCNPVAPEDFMYVSPEPVRNMKGVVYGCITNGYDLPKDPVLVDENLSYVMFTDAPWTGDGTIWETRAIDHIEVMPGSSFANRYYKFHPFELFSDFDYSIYVDGNVRIVSDVTGLYRIAHESPIGIAMHTHAEKNCAYKDALWCEYHNRGVVPAIKAQAEKYRNEGFPEEFGLCEATIIVVDLHSDIARDVMDVWWTEFCRAGGMRDQIAFPYVIWRLGLKMSDVGCLGNDEYHNPKFMITSHETDVLV